MLGPVLRWRLAYAVPGILLLLAGCPPGSRTAIRPEPQPRPPYDRPECPEHEIALTVFDSMDHAWVPRIVTDIPIAPTIDDIPEFHDCQRLVQTGKPEYGPLAGIFASEAIDTLHGIYDERGTLRNPADAGTRLRRGSAAAQIFSFDDEPYLPLHIRREFNCLYLVPPEVGGGTWRAYMVWARSDAERCKQPLGDPALAQSLSVHVHGAGEYEGGPFPPNAIPPVARWDIDRQGRQTIGIKCGAWWCSIGEAGFAPRPSEGNAIAAQLAAAMPPGTTPNSQGVRRVTQVRGWYDEQQLALPSPSGTAGLSPRGPHALFFPDPALGDWNDAMDFADWRPVAYVLLRGPAQAYAEKLNLGAGMTRFDMIFRKSGDPMPSDPGLPVDCAESGGGTWWMRMTRTDGSGPARYHCVTARTHPNAARLPGTVRWRWKIDDETTWVRCPEGCCSVS